MKLETWGRRDRWAVKLVGQSCVVEVSSGGELAVNWGKLARGTDPK